MAQKVGDLVFNVVARTGQLAAGLAQAEGTIKSFSGKFASSLNLGGALLAGQGGLGTLGNVVSMLGSIPTPAAAATLAIGGTAAALTTLGVAAVGLSAEKEKILTSFEVMLQSAERAQQMFSALQEYARVTPFESPEVQDAAKRLLAMGVEAKNVLPTIRMLGEVSAATNQPIAELAQVFGEVNVAGRLTANELRQFTMRGVPLMEALAKSLGVTKMEVKDMVTDTKVSFADVVKAFESMGAAGGRFEGMTKKQSETFLGLWSTVKDNFKILMTQMGDLLLPLGKGILKFLNYVLEGANKLIEMVRGKKLDMGEFTSTKFDFSTLDKTIDKAAIKAEEKAEKAAEKAAAKLEKTKEKQDAKALAKILKDTEDREKKIAAAAEKVRQSVLKPSEKFAEETAELKNLLAIGAITKDIYDRAFEKARADMAEAEGKAQKLKDILEGVSAKERFSTDAFSAVQERMRKSQFGDREGVAPVVAGLGKVEAEVRKVRDAVVKEEAVKIARVHF